MLKFPSLKVLCICSLIIGIVSCDGNPTETDVPEPPTMPELQNYQPETSYFTGNSNKSVQNGTGFDLAAQLMQGTVGGLFQSTQVYFPFFSQAQSVEPSYSDGVFEWTYTYSPAEASATAEVRLTADPDSDAQEVDWALYITTSGTQGPNFDNYKFMDGTTATDGTAGNWSIYPFQSEGSSPIITYQWTREDETSYTASYDIDLQQTSTSYSIDYTKDQPEHTLELTSSTGEQDVTVFWNTDSDTGYIDPANEGRICWNSAHENVACQ